MDVRPPVFSVRLSSILSFPYRFCHPPTPTVAKVRSCSITPYFQVNLDDVLDRRHLPPLGLKDFEEWLLFVEQKPQYLYFILWLKEYKRRYTQWIKTAEQTTRTGTRPICGPLAIFYTRAKQTFFPQLSPYHLTEISQHTLAQFLHPPMDSAIDSPHPHPSAFDRIESEARAILSRSLEVFVRASCANVSSFRIICGVIGAFLFGLIFGVLPLLLVIFLASSRWLRWIALPGLMVGSTIFISSFHGVCLAVYVFGDARQLRDFELVRPPIEKTSAMAISPITPVPSFSPSMPSPAAMIRHKWVAEQSLRRGTISSRISIHSASTHPTTSEAHATNSSPTGIYVSPAMDPDTGECSRRTSLHHTGSHAGQQFTTTSSFISREGYSIDQSKGTQDCHPPEGEELFNFDGLPLHPKLLAGKDSTSISQPLEKHSTTRPRLQSAPPPGAEIDLESGKLPSQGFRPPQVPVQPIRKPDTDEAEPHYGNVPLFGPQTQVVSPVVRRAHWEVVARSSAIGGVVSLAVVGALVGIPQMKFMEALM